LRRDLEFQFGFSAHYGLVSVCTFGPISNEAEHVGLKK
jgi:hypothetical protein